MSKKKHVSDYELFLENRRKSSAALAAEDARKELKLAYPEVKFSVTSETYSGGSSIRVNYTNGPSYRDVKSLLDKYQYGDFDSMTDMYDMKGKDEEIATNTVKYVSVSRDIRDMSNSLMEVADIDSERARRILSERAIPTGAISVKSASQDAINFSLEGEIEYNYEDKPVKSTKKEKEIVSEKEPKFTPKDRGDVRIVDYSEKSIAVIGNTFDVKDKLKELNARFNKFLTIDGEKQAGWILPKTKKEDVEKALGL